MGQVNDDAWITRKVDKGGLAAEFQVHFGRSSRERGSAVVQSPLIVTSQMSAEEDQHVLGGAAGSGHAADCQLLPNRASADDGVGADVGDSASIDSEDARQLIRQVRIRRDGEGRGRAAARVAVTFVANNGLLGSVVGVQEVVEVVGGVAVFEVVLNHNAPGAARTNLAQREPVVDPLSV